MQSRVTGFIGGGNMARSIIGGLLAASQDPQQRERADDAVPPSILVSEPDEARRTQLGADFGVQTTTDNNEVAAGAGLLVLAVKPQAMADVCAEIGDTCRRHKPLLLSIAAGVRCDDMQRQLGGGIAIVRAMPNTPALVNCGAGALFANALCDEAQRSQAQRLMAAVGITAWVEEERLLDAITALSGCGPAYFLHLLEVMAQSAVAAGIDERTARDFALQTAFGTAVLAQRDEADFAELRRRVTSPGGATERALEVMEREGFARAAAAGFNAAAERSREMADASRGEP